MCQNIMQWRPEAQCTVGCIFARSTFHMNIRSFLVRAYRAFQDRMASRLGRDAGEAPRGPSTPIDSEPVRSAPDYQPNRFSAATVLLLLLTGIALFIPLMALFVVPLILAATFAALLYPLYRFLFYRLWRQRAIASLVCCFALVVGMLLPAYALVQIAVSQGAELYQAVRPAVQQFFQDGARARWLEMLRDIQVGRWLIEQVDWRAVITSLQSAAASLGTTILNRTSAGVFGLVANLLITIFIVFYFLMDGKRITAAIGNLLPVPVDYKRRIVENFLRISRATVAGTLVIGLVQGSLGAFILLVFGIDAWLFWGFVMLILSVVPMVGPPVVLIPAGAFHIMRGNMWTGIGIILSSMLVVSTVDNVLRPVVVGHGARMHGLLVFIATLGGLSVFGIAGFIVGPAIASFLVAVIGIYRIEFVDRLQPFEQQQQDL